MPANSSDALEPTATTPAATARLDDDGPAAPAAAEQTVDEPPSASNPPLADSTSSTVVSSIVQTSVPIANSSDHNTTLNDTAAAAPTAVGGAGADGASSVSAPAPRDDHDLDSSRGTEKLEESKSRATVPATAASPSSPSPSSAPKDDSTSPLPAAAKEVAELGPTLTLTLLLITGSRHQFKIDAKYLRKRSVTVENQNPFLMSVYTLKELIWREWRPDWESRPSSPSSIRLISFGKLLDDKTALSESRFSEAGPNVVHMTVKPQEIVDEEDAKGAKAQSTRDQSSSERSPGCRCVIL